MTKIKNEKVKDLIYRVQGFGLWLLSKIFIILGIRISSFLIGTLFVIFGPLTPPSFLALKNIKKALPEFTTFQRFKVVLGMWNNLGRDLAEFVGFHSLNIKDMSKYLNIDSDCDKVLQEMANNKNGGIIFTAHFGNWELFSNVFLKYDIPVSAIYRNLNNKYADDIVLKYREKSSIDMIPKGQKGIMKLAKSLKIGRKIFMLVDQRLNNGITVPFFNIPSKTTDAPAVFALKNGYKLYSAVIFRRSYSCYFDLKIEEFEIVNTGDFKKDVEETTKKINQKIEEWIKTKPEQWFWVHNRWKE